MWSNNPMGRCTRSKRKLSVESEPLSGDCCGDCWGCIGEIEAEAGFEPSLQVVMEEWKAGLRPNWKPSIKRRPAKPPS